MGEARAAGQVVVTVYTCFRVMWQYS